MSISKQARSGTLESNDVLVQIGPGEGTVEITLTSIVKAQFGEEMERVAREVLAEQGIASAKLELTDRGALECTLRARLETAIRRAQ